MYAVQAVPFSIIGNAFPFLHTAVASVPQQKILDNEFALAASKWSAAITAGYLAISGFWTGFDFDDVIDRLAIRAFEERLR
jgi:hypothetical protein